MEILYNTINDLIYLSYYEVNVFYMEVIIKSKLEHKFFLHSFLKLFNIYPFQQSVCDLWF